MSELRDATGRPTVRRPEALALRAAGLCSYTQLRQRNNWQAFIQALRSAGVRNAQDRAQVIQQSIRDWHLTLRERTRTRLEATVPNDTQLISNFFDAREKAFEAAFERLLERSGIKFTLFDDRSAPGRFDYLVHIPDRPDFIVECKTHQGSTLVDLEAARVVLASAVQWGHHDKFCVTLCNIGINPDVLPSLDQCSKLGVVEAHVMAGALVQVILGKLSIAGFSDWITQPGLAKLDNVFAYCRAQGDNGGAIPATGTSILAPAVAPA